MPKLHKEGEAFRYMENARGLLKAASIENNFYIDIKSVREAFGTAYLAVTEREGGRKYDNSRSY
jgi:hypothetical protein